MTASPLDRLLRPQTIAVFGGREARRVIEQCDRMGFSGKIWPVHPKLDEVLGRACYRSVSDLPSAPDAAFVGVNRTLTVEIVRSLSAAGAGGAVCYASGFSEATGELGDGAELQQALLEAAGDMPIDAGEQAERLGFPVVLKALGIAHKTEAGAVALNLKDVETVSNAAAAMPLNAGYLVEKMIDPPVAELIVGAVRDPVFGLSLTLGAGGILVELLEDSVILPLPATKTEIYAAISRLKLAKLIYGYRGRPKGDLDAAVVAIAAAADYVVTNAAWLEELDINPLMVLPEGQGVAAVDALIRRRR
ncbi:hypothetical protein HJB82_01135 [Rhizobium sp. NZLR10]|nr:acetate--CoA ligase family protein [Rhizobium sp. NZLR10]MBX5193939.1 hypothetical protein [Rhizobium sp. NZLR10]